jgi:hypothetical protein
MSRTAADPISADTLRFAGNVKYSICTLVTRVAQYREMVESFHNKGFSEPDCEFLFLDNSERNTYDAFAGYNLFLRRARGELIILCHQDVVLIDDGRTKLDEVIADLERRDRNWGVCGNSGGMSVGRLAIRISDPHGADQRTVSLPARVRSLDENFMVVRAEANLALSHDLAGFHLYGTDLCIVADILGLNCYVIDFHLAHLSAGVKDASFAQVRSALIRKYARGFRSRWLATPNTLLFLTGAAFLLPLNGRTVTRVIGALKRVISAFGSAA